MISDVGESDGGGGNIGKTSHQATKPTSVPSCLPSATGTMRRISHSALDVLLLLPMMVMVMCTVIAFIPFAAETCGGLGPQALQLLRLIASRALEQLSIWPHHDIVQHMLGSVAVAIQRGNAMTVLSGYSMMLVKGGVDRGREQHDDTARVAAAA